MRNIKKLHSRCVGDLGSILACKHKPYVILGEKDMAALCIVLRLIVLYPEDLCGSPACESRIGSYLNELFSANLFVHFLNFSGSSLVAPDNGLSDDLVVFVQHYKAVHLSRKTYTHDILLGNATLCDNTLYGIYSRIVPVSRILLRIAVLGLIHGIFYCH